MKAVERSSLEEDFGKYDKDCISFKDFLQCTNRYCMYTHVCVCYTLNTRVSADGKLNFRSMLMRILCLLPLTSLASRCWSCHHFWGLQVNGLLPQFYEPPHHGSPEEAAAAEAKASWLHGPQPEKLAMHLFGYFTSLIPLQAQSGGG